MHRQQRYSHNKQRQMRNNRRAKQKHQRPSRTLIAFVSVGIFTGGSIAAIAAYHTAFSPQQEAKIYSRSSPSVISSALISQPPQGIEENEVKYSPRIDEATLQSVLQALPKSANDYYHQVTESEPSSDYDTVPINVYRITQDPLSAEQFRILTRFGSNLAQDNYRKAADLLESIETLFGPNAKERAIRFIFKDYNDYLKSIEAAKCNGYDTSSVFQKIMYMKILTEQLGVSNYFSPTQSELEKRVWTMCADYLPQNADAGKPKH